MRIKILSWNVKGANSDEKRKLIKAFLKWYKADLFCIQKTKLKGLTHGIIRSLMVAWLPMWRALLVGFKSSRILQFSG